MKKANGYVLNPRGTPLYEDSNRFGTRMLEKMGWTKGKGLGVNLDGDQNFIRVNHRINLFGVGFAVHSDQWTQHDINYDSLLKSLDNNLVVKQDNSTDDTNKSISFKSSDCDYFIDDKNSNNFLHDKSLEELSKKSRSRVHYKKFVRGKDTSQYNEKDLANIFGKKTLYENSDVKVNEKTSERDEKVMPDFGITTIKTGTSIDDYFKMKRQQLQQTQISSNIKDDEHLHKTLKKSKNKYKNDGFNKRADHNILFDCDTMIIKKKKNEFKEITDKHILDTIPEPNQLNNKTIKRKEKRQLTNKTANSIDLDKMKLNVGISDFIEKQNNSENNNETVKKIKIKKKHTESPVKHANGHSPESIENDQIIVSNDTNLIKNVLINLLEQQLSSVQPINNNIREVFEITRYKAEIFRFLDMDAFNFSSLNTISGYGFSENFELKVNTNNHDTEKINSLWDQAIISKYGKDAIVAKKKQKYSTKALKKKKLFMTI